MFQIFKLAVSISTPLSLAGFMLAILFYIFRENAKGKDHAQSAVFSYVFVLALVIAILGIAAWFWANLGYTTMEGTLYVYRSSNFQQSVETRIPIRVLQIRESGETDEYGRFSVPLKKGDLKKHYTVMVVVDSIQKFFSANPDEDDFGDLILRDTINSKSVKRLRKYGPRAVSLQNGSPKVSGNSNSQIDYCTFPTFDIRPGQPDCIAYSGKYVNSVNGVFSNAPNGDWAKATPSNWLAIISPGIGPTGRVAVKINTRQKKFEIAYTDSTPTKFVQDYFVYLGWDKKTHRITYKQMVGAN